VKKMFADTSFFVAFYNKRDKYIEKLKDFRRFFPEYADRKVVGAVAGIVIEGGADRFAYRQGMFVIAQKGENVTILNDSKFTPKEF